MVPTNTPNISIKTNQILGFARAANFHRQLDPYRCALFVKETHDQRIATILDRNRSKAE